MPPDLLNLDGYAVDSFHETDSGRFIVAHLIEVDRRCPRCGGEFRAVRRYSRGVWDAPHGAKTVHITLTIPIRRCESCDLNQSEQPSGLDSRHGVTIRLVQFVRRQLELRQSITWIALNTGPSERTIQRLKAEWQEERRRTRDLKCPVYLGIDEIHTHLGTLCVLVDLGQRKHFAILEDNRTSTIIKFLCTLTDHEKVKAVAMDFCPAYRAVPLLMFPNAIPVIDEAHALKEAREQFQNAKREVIKRHVDQALKAAGGRIELPADPTAQIDLLQNFRRRLLKPIRSMQTDARLFTTPRHRLSKPERAKLERYFCAIPELRESYECFQRICTWYRGNFDADGASDAFVEIEASLSDSTHELWRPFFDKIAERDNEIWAYFTTGLTNACTEALNRVLRTEISKCPGISLDDLRAKLIFGHAPTREIRKRRAPAHSAPPPSRPAFKRRRSRRPSKWTEQGELFTGDPPAKPAA